MSGLVEMKKNEAFTTSKVIAEGTNNKHDSIVKLIQKHENDILDFGKIRFTDFKSENLQGGRADMIHN